MFDIVESLFQKICSLLGDETRDFILALVIFCCGKISHISLENTYLHVYLNKKIYKKKYQLSTPYSFRNIAGTRFYRSRSIGQRPKVKSRSHYDVANVHTLTNVPTKYQLPTPYSC